MAFQAKFTAKRGSPDPADVTIAAGTAEAQSDTISLNMDITNMTKGDVLVLLESIEQAIFTAQFPPL